MPVYLRLSDKSGDLNERVHVSSGQEKRVSSTQAACDARVEQVECELKLERIRREQDERFEEKTRAKEDRTAREKTVQAWREEETRRRQERRERWHRRFQSWQDRRRKRREASGGQSGTMRVLLALGIPAVLALIVYSRNLEGADGKRVFAVGLLTAVSAFAAGALLGFLFGIPRSVAAHRVEAKEAAAAESKSTAEEAAAAAQRFAPNTNLEEISDWLTKILVGVGLVQIHQAGGAIEDLANGLAPGLGSDGYTVAVALMVSFSITGFVSAYLYTRLRLQSAFELASVIKQAIKERADTETSAIALVQEQLTPGGDNRPTLAALTDALKAATPGVRSQAFFLARRQRQETLGEGSDEEETEFTRLSIPVFRALIDCDTDERFHRPRAELGYALMTQKPMPDFPAAQAALDKAIKVRKPVDASRTPGYELNRAYCTVAMEHGGVSTEPVIDAVCADLSAGLAAGGKLDDEKRTTIKQWLTNNSGSATSSQRRASELLSSIEKMPSSSR
jgi:hypothetical protein